MSTHEIASEGTGNTAPSVTPRNPLLELFSLRFVQALALVAGLATISWGTLVSKLCVRDLDTYWHLAVGDWILQHGAVPHTGIFSRTAAHMPWVAYSWGTEVILSRVYAWFGLIGIGIYGLALTFLVAITLLWSLMRLSRRFWVGFALWISGCACFLYSLAPRPVFFSMAFFIIVLTLVLETLRDGNFRRLLWLPALFLVWANLHIQFLYGLFPLGLMAAPAALELCARVDPRLTAWMRKHTDPVRVALWPTVLLTLTAMALTCVGPYWYHLYEVILKYGHATITYSTIQELQPVSYTYKVQYLALALTAGAFLLLGRQRVLAPYHILLVLAATVISARTVRDTWFVCTCVLLVMADLLRPEESETPSPLARLGSLGLGGTAAGFAVITLLLAMNTNFTTRGLNQAIATKFPVSACNFLRQAELPGPMYNSFDWGGFLTWYMPMYPVAVDGRNDLYDGKLGETLLLTQGEPGAYRNDPYLAESGFALVRTGDPLARSLAADGNYRRIYSDGQADIYVPASAPTAP